MDEQRYVLVMVPASRVKEVPVEGRRDAVILGPDGGVTAGCPHSIRRPRAGLPVSRARVTNRRVTPG